MITPSIFVYYFPWAEVIGGAATIGTGAINMGSQGKMNKKNMAHQKLMYQNSLNDQRYNWEMQNAYNNPSAAMERLKAAGLNPALMYGGSGATGQAGSVGSPTMPSAATTAPQLDYAASGAITNAAKAIQYQQQQKNVELTDAQIRKTQAETDGKLIENNFAPESNQLRQNLDYNKMLKLSADTENSEATREQIKARTAQIVSDTQVNQARSAQTIEQGKVQMAQMMNAMQIANDQNAWNNANQKFDLDMKRVGISPNSNEWWRMFGTMLKDLNNQSGGEGKSFIDRGLEYLKNYTPSK